MDLPSILPDLGEPVSTAAINFDEAELSSFGELLHAAALLTQMAAEKSANPLTYLEVATYRNADGTDWSGYQPVPEKVKDGHVSDPADQSSSGLSDPAELPRPVAPDNYCDTLPAIGHVLSQLDRFQEGIQLNFARYVESSMKYQDKYFGTPFKDSLFKDATQYLVETMRISRYRAKRLCERGTYFAHQPGADPALKSSQPVFPQVAEAIMSGQVPIENADRIMTLDQDLAKYSAKVGQPLARKEAALAAFEPTMAEAASAVTPDELTKAKHRWLAKVAHWVCADGPQPSKVLAKQANNELRTRQHSDGSATISMHATPDLHAAFKNFCLYQLNFNGTPVKISEDLLNLLTSLHKTSTAQHADEDTDPNEPTLGDVLGPFDTWDTSPDPDSIVAEDASGNPVEAREINGLDRLTTGQRIAAILIGMFKTISTMDPDEIGAKKAHGAAAQVMIVQDIETAYHTLGIDKIPEAARRPDGPDGLLPSVIKRPNPDDPDTPHCLDNPYQYSQHVPPEPDTTEPGTPVPWTPYQSEAVNIGTIHPSDAEILACDSELVGQIWDGPDTVLQQKRAFRLYTAVQRRAILARDKGCQAPGCTTPAVYCDIHHVKEWAAGGKTDETNAITLCPHHHGAVHNGKWTIRRHQGLTFFQPAPWLDPSRPLLRNLYWNV